MSPTAVEPPPASASRRPDDGADDAEATAREATREAVAAILPMAIGFVPFALVIGTAVAEHHAGVAGWAGSWLIYGGSAHLSALRLVDTSGAAVAIVTALLVNTRLLVYSASLGRRWGRSQPRWFRFAAAALVIDPTWALTAPRPLQSPAAERRFFLTAGLVLGVVWSLAIGVGATLGARLHLASLDVVAPLCLVALVAPRLAQRAERPVVAAAAAVTAAGAHLPAGTAVLAAIAAGWVAGEVADAREARRRPVPAPSTEVAP